MTLNKDTINDNNNSNNNDNLYFQWYIGCYKHKFNIYNLQKG